MIDPLELHAYADGELGNEDRARVDSLLGADAAAKAQLESIQDLKQAVATYAQPVECKSEWKACVARLDELDKAKRTESFVGKYAWALCGAFFLFILAGGFFNRMLPGREMQAADVMRAAASLTQSSSPRSQESRAKAEFLDQLVGRASRSISTDQLRFVGGATGEVDGHRISRIGLQDAEGDLSLIVIYGPVDLETFEPSTDPRFKQGKIQGLNCVAWDTPNATMLLAGERSCDQLVETVLNKIVRSSR